MEMALCERDVGLLCLDRIICEMFLRLGEISFQYVKCFDF